jgi:hypothetical protein
MLKRPASPNLQVTPSGVDARRRGARTLRNRPPTGGELVKRVAMVSRIPNPPSGSPCRCLRRRAAARTGWCNSMVGLDAPVAARGVPRPVGLVARVPLGPPTVQGLLAARPGPVVTCQGAAGPLDAHHHRWRRCGMGGLPGARTLPALWHGLTVRHKTGPRRGDTGRRGNP